MSRSWPAERTLPAHESEFDFASTLQLLARRWRLLGGLVLLAAGGVAGLLLVRGPTFYARATLAAVVSSRSAGLPGGLASSLLSGGQAGLQASPALLVSLLQLPGVLDRVAAAPHAGRPIGAILQPQPGTDQGRREQIARRVEASFDRQSGLVQLTVTERDSALARAIAQRVLDEASASFRAALRAQAVQLNQAQVRRVDSAAVQLRRAENRLQSFAASHRLFSAYAIDATERARLQRELEIAQTVYAKAINDRESAIAGELEETPALVVVDALPRELPVLPRGLVLKTLGAALGGLLIGVLWVLVDARLRGGPRRYGAVRVHDDTGTPSVRLPSDVTLPGASVRASARASDVAVSSAAP